MKKLLFILLIVLADCTFASGSIQPLPEQQAFAISAKLFGNDTVLISWQIAPKHYLYRNRISFNVLKPNNANVGTLLLPQGKWKEDDILGKYQIYDNDLTIPVPIINSNFTHTQLQIRYQGCSEDGYCYPPTTQIANIDFKQGKVTFADNSSQGNKNINDISGDKFAALLADHHLITILLAFLGFGLLLSFTPCVLPMVPIISGIIVGHGQTITTGKAFRLSLVYVLSMACTYAIAGMLIGYLGSSLQAAMQKPWVLITFSLLFVVLALSFFGFYQLRLPARFEEGIANFSRHQKSGHYIGVVIMGCLATLIVSPCVTPALVGVLGYIAKTGNALLGGAALFALGFGMGLPLIVIGTAGGKLLPKAGTWMKTVENIFGVLFLAIAIWMLERIIPTTITMLLWSILCIVSAIYMGSLSPTPENNWRKLWKGLGLIVLVYGILLLIGVAMGNSNPLKPLSSNANVNSTNKTMSQLQFTRIKSLNEVHTIITQAKSEHKPVMLDFYADWCIACKEMEYSTFSNPNVINASANFIRLQADVTANDTTDKQLMQAFGVIAPPTILFFNSKGQLLSNLTIIGKQDTADFLARLQQVN